MQTPNQTTTWGRDIEDFTAWRARQHASFVSEETALLCYLQHQLKVESAELKTLSFNEPLLGLMSHLGETNERARELLLAYLALTVAGDASPARALIAGRRLNPNLHPEYAARTRCYG